MNSAGTVSMWMAVRAGCCATPSTFQIDGVTKQSFTANTTTPGAYYSYAVSAGSHTYSWNLNTTQPAYWYLDDFTLTSSTGSTKAATFIGGNVGIGTINPGATLETDGTAIFKGSTASIFQLQNNIGTQILNADATTNSITIGQGNLTVSGLATPSAPTLTSSASGGSLAAATYYYQLAAVNVNGTTPSVSSNPISVTTTGSVSQNTLTWTAVSNASSYNVYRSTDNTNWKINNVSSATLSMVDNGSNFSWSTVATLPTTNTTGGNLSAAALNVQASTSGISVGFESGALAPFTAASGWVVTTSPHTGTYGATITGTSNPAVPNSTPLQITQTFSAAGTWSFWAGGGCGYSFKIDSTVVSSGTIGAYSFFSFPVTIGTHTLSYISTVGACAFSAPFLAIDDITITGLSTGSTTVALFNGGNVGIGTVAPTANLDVEGTVVFNNGTVGIGTSTPTATLEVDGTGLFKAATGADSASLFQVQNAAGSKMLNVDTLTNTNILTNGSAETGTTGWAALGSASLAQSTTQRYIGTSSLAVTTTAAANDGAKYNLTTTTLASNTKYTLSLMARLAPGQSMATFQVGRAEDGSTFTSCLTAQTVSSTGWTNFTCTFTTGTTSSTPFIYVRQTDATVRNIYIDAIQLTRFSLLTNASIEQAIAGNWAVKGSAAVTQDATQFFDGTKSLKIVTTAANNDGAKQSITLNDSTFYTVSFQALNTGAAFATMEAGYSSDGTNDDTPCTTAQTVSGAWSTYTCTFTTPGFHSGTPYFYIKQTNNVVHTFYVDAVQLVQGNPVSAYREGIISLNDVINSPAVFQNQSDSTNSFQVQNSSGTTIVGVDTINKSLKVNGGANYSTISYSGGIGFATHVDYTTASAPRGTVIGSNSIGSADLNGDGKADIAYIDSSGNNLRIYLNDGSGGFSSFSSYATGGAGPVPQQLTIADFDGDGDKDVAMTLRGTDKFVVFMNNGNGTFAGHVDYGTGSSPWGIGAADFNGDGKPDIVVDHLNSNNIYVYPNNGDGTFGAASSYSSSFDTYGLSVDDVTGDGKADIVLDWYTGGKVSVYVNSGTGTFGAKTDYTVGSNPLVSAIGDLNGDSANDIVAANSGSTNFSVLLNGLTATNVTHYGGISVAAPNASTTGLIIQGAASQTDDLLRVQDSTGSAYLEVSSAGLLKVNTLDSITGNLTIGANSTAIILQNATRVAAHQGFTALGSALFQDATNSTAAFQVQDSSGVSLLAVNTTSRIITISGDTTTFGNLTLTNAHVKSTQTTLPTIGTPSNCGSSPTATVVASSTDSAGSLTITTGTGALGAGTCDTVFTFNKAYGAAPKAIIVTPKTATGADKQVYVSASSTTTFTIKFNTAASVNSEANSFYYWVIE
jgi:hypothetical protein